MPNVSREQVEAQLVQVLVDDFDVDRDQLTPETNFFSDLQLDSIDLLSAITQLEETYDLTIPNDDLPEMITLGGCVDKLTERLQAAA